MRKSIIIGFLVFLSIVLTYGFVDAKVTGICANCHTMHNSQNGTEVATAGPAPGDTTPHENLLLQTCLGCHSSSDYSEYYALGGCNVPVVYYTAGEPSIYLAGGNFWWVADAGGDDDTKGHNVFYNEADGNLSMAPGEPGFASCGTNNCHTNMHEIVSGSGFSNLDGRYGCTSCHMVTGAGYPQGYHHADDGNGTKYVDTAAKGWYRFLSGHMSGDGHGVIGIEDEDWQATSSETDHNEYYGWNDNLKTSWGAFFNLGHSMTAFCCGCHGDFHVQDTTSTGASPWIRHPSDAILPATGEYSAYTAYSTEAPVARPAGFDWGSGPSGTVTPGQDMVMCLSCHRPHGSPYPDMLRWDYTEMIAGDNTKTGGCFTCHTQKNQTP